MRTKAWTVVGSIALAACSPPGTEAPKRTAGGEVPEALALALIANAAEESRIFVGPAPSVVEAILPLVEDLPVVGGLTRDNGGTIVFGLPGSPEAALATYAERIELEGWEPAPNDRGIRGGFQRSPQRIAGTWCTETHWLRASSISFAGGEYLRVRYYETEMEPTPCVNAARMTEMSMGRYGLRMPVLQAPPGAQVEMSGGGGSTNEVNMNATVVTELSAEELFDHYARQVTRDGWGEGTATSGDGLAIGRWTARDDTGGPAQGVLAVWPMPQANTYGAWIRMGRVRSER